MSAIAVIEDSKKVFAVQADPKYLTPFITVGKAKMPQGCVLAATGAYNDGGVPIGFLWDGDECFRSKRTEKDWLRTYFAWDGDGPDIGPGWLVETTDKLIMQIGPRLVKSGQPCWQGNPEKFQPDATRRADHVVYGLTPAGKLIVAYWFNASQKEMADGMIRLGCVSAAKADGGSKSYLEFDGRRLGNQGVVPCAFCLKARKANV